MGQEIAHNSITACKQLALAATGVKPVGASHVGIGLVFVELNGLSKLMDYDCVNTSRLNEVCKYPV